MAIARLFPLHLPPSAGSALYIAHTRTRTRTHTSRTHAQHARLPFLSLLSTRLSVNSLLEDGCDDTSPLCLSFALALSLLQRAHTHTHIHTHTLTSALSLSLSLSLFIPPFPSLPLHIRPLSLLSFFVLRLPVSAATYRESTARTAAWYSPRSINTTLDTRPMVQRSRKPLCVCACVCAWKASARTWSPFFLLKLKNRSPCLYS